MFTLPCFVSGVLKLFHDTLLFAGPVLLQNIIAFVGQKDPHQVVHRTATE
jgi:hypothetical protein